MKAHLSKIIVDDGNSSSDNFSEKRYVYLNDIPRQPQQQVIYDNTVDKRNIIPSKVLIIDNGTIIETSEVKEFKNNGNKYTFNVSNTKDLDIEGIYEVTKNKFSYNGEKEDIASIIKTLVKKNIDVYEVKMEELTLEEAFLKKTGGKKNDKVNKK